MQEKSLKQSNVSRPIVHRVLAIGFAVLIFSVPAVQWLDDVLASRPPRAARLYDDVSRAMDDAVSDGSAWSTVMAKSSAAKTALAEYGQSLALDSPVRRGALKTVGRMWPAWLHAHDGRFVIGTDGWVYHRPDLDWVLGRGFLDPPATSASDPRSAIQAFHRDLQSRGVHLVLMPIPAKPTIHPEGLTQTTDPVTNTEMDAFKQWAAEQGIDLYDPTDLLASRLPNGPQFLKTDTHWRPEAMTAVAEHLARHIEPWAHNEKNFSPTAYRIEKQTIRHVGDTAQSVPNSPFAPEEVTVQRVLTPDGHAWSSSEDSAIVLLGDSFANIYSDPTMQWSGSAGLPEQVSRFLSTDVHAIVFNGGGANETRRMFVDRAHRNPFQLQQIKVVVWEFAARDLALDSWDVIRFKD